MKIQYIRKAETIADVREQITNAPVLGVDTETTDLDPFKGRLRLLQVSTDAENVNVFDFDHLDARSSEFDFMRDALADEQKVKAFHNAKFDLRFLRQHFNATTVNAIHDTFLASQLLACGDEMTRHNLGAVAARFAFIDLDKALQKSDWSGEISDNQLRYAARDATTLHPIRDVQNRQMTALDLLRVAQLEFEAVPAIAEMEHTGFYLNSVPWLARIERQEGERDQIAEKMHKHFLAVTRQENLFGGVSDINLDSPEQVADALTRLGVPIDASTLEHKIKHLAKKHQVVADLIEYRGIAQALKTFGRAYIKFIHEVTGRVHADFRQIGAPTGRMSCGDPNLQQIPTDKEYRNCFQAPPGRKLIIADYSQIELRIMAQFSRDEKLLYAYEHDIDLHRQTGSGVFHVDFDAVTSHHRDIGKRLNFGTAYGVGAKRFSQVSGLSVDESGDLLRKFWKLYTQLDAYLIEAGRRAVDDRESHSFSGRTWRFDYDKADQNAVSQVERLGRNFPIQATCSDILKRALPLVHRALKPFNDAKLVNLVHDEKIVECDADEAEAVALVVEQKMVEAGAEVLSAVPCKVDYKIRDMWEK